MFNKNDKKTNISCPECKHPVYEDQRKLELYCPHCGLVIQNKDTNIHNSS